jgi:hypothetical protein
MSSMPVALDVLSGVPSHGWVGRRDRALLVLGQLAGLSYPQIADLTAADVSVTGGTAMIRTRTTTVILERSEGTALCGPCALARWLHLLDMTVIYPHDCVAAAVLARSAPLIGGSPHACLTDPHPDQAIRVQHLALLPAVDPWGILTPLPGTRRRTVHADSAGPADLWHERHTSADQLEHRTEQLLGAPTTHPRDGTEPRPAQQLERGPRSIP